MPVFSVGLSLNLAERTSGKYRGQSQLSTRGHALLPQHLFNAVFHVVGNQPDFHVWYTHDVPVPRLTPRPLVMRLIPGSLAGGAQWREPAALAICRDE